MQSYVLSFSSRKDKQKIESLVGRNLQTELSKTFYNSCYMGELSLL